jgi:hypothetical protein
MKKLMIVVMVGAMLLGGAAGSAQAGDHEWAVAGKVLAGMIVLDALTSPCRTTVVYEQPVYYAPPVVQPTVVYRPPVVYHPPVVYTRPVVYPRPVVYRRPVITCPPPIHRHGHYRRVPPRPVWQPVCHPRPVYGHHGGHRR